MVKLRFLLGKVFIPVIIGILIITVFLTIKSTDNSNNKGEIRGSFTNLPSGLKSLVERQLPNGQFVAILDHEVFTGLGIALLDKDHGFIQWLPEAEYLGPNEGDKYPGQYVDWWELSDINNDGRTELAIELIVSGSGLSHPFYLYQYQDDSFKLLLKFGDGVSHTELVDLNEDGGKEIIYSFVLDSTGNIGRTLTPWKEVWTWQSGQYQLTNHLYPKIYQDMIPMYIDLIENVKKNNVAQSYQKVLFCLKEKAELNSQGIFANGRECSSLIPGFE